MYGFLDVNTFLESMHILAMFGSQGKFEGKKKNKNKKINKVNKLFFISFFKFISFIISH